MDHLELRRQLPPGLVAIVLRWLVGLAAVASVVGCAPDESTSSFGRGSTTEPPLPTATSAEASTDEETAADEVDEADGAATSAAMSTVPLAPLQGLGAEVVAEGFDQPIHVTSAPGSDRLFVVEREGVIHTVGPDGVDPEPFLDARDRLLSSSIEQGLLGLVFHPRFAENGRLFAYWTDTDGDSVLARFTASIGPDGVPVLDEGSQHTMLQIEQPAERHNAGMLAFGPDGLLYVAVGDGGSGGRTAQDTTNLLGSILRLDVDGNGDGPDAYAIPEGNPFDDEIWVYGLRNPWRFWIDDETDLVYIGDVGQERFEELNVIGLDGAGTNFGWFLTEGDQCFRDGCDTDGLTPPVLQYGRDEGCSITGGIVYRGGLIPEFDGHYFYGDWCKGFVRSLRFDGRRVQDQFDWTNELDMGQVTSFGVGPDGELYAVNWEGKLLTLVAER
ncbi:MAG: PQQ-dependent sugar dehydrogenase [Actinomycetota bacterium]